MAGGTKHPNLKFMHLNVRGFKKDTQKEKLPYLKTIVYGEDIKISSFCELCPLHDNITALKKINWKDEFPEFEFYKNRTDNGNETGILIYSNIEHEEFVVPKEYAINGNQWSCYVIYKSKNKNILYCSYYRSPSEREYEEDEQILDAEQADPIKLLREINYIKQKRKIDSIIINGDFNIKSQIWDQFHIGKNNPLEESIVKLCEELDLKLINNENFATRAATVNRNNKKEILGYSTIDLTLISNNLSNDVKNWETNSQCIYENMQNIQEYEQKKIDLWWLENISDHFLITFEINKIYDKMIIKLHVKYGIVIVINLMIIDIY